jgi:hypothetical protein
MPSGAVYSIEVDMVYNMVLCNGSFQTVDTIALPRYAQWNGTGWSRMGTLTFDVCGEQNVGLSYSMTQYC